MSRPEQLARAYTAARPRLLRVAYSLLGDRAEAEDVISEVWLRLGQGDAREPVEDVEAWAVVAVARRALDVLRSARARRESYVGPWLPEPVVGPLRTNPDTADPADQVLLDDSVSYVVLVVLESLTPAERGAWVLHDLFGMSFAHVAAIVGRTPAAVRQLASRARRHVAAHATRVEVDTAEHQAVVTAFLEAAAGGDLAGLLRVLDPHVTATSDGGGQVRAARRPVQGADRVARFVLGLAGRIGAGQQVHLAQVNGALGFVLADGDRVALVASLTVQDGRVRRLDLVQAPDKLTGVRPESVRATSHAASSADATD